MASSSTNSHYEILGQKGAKWVVIDIKNDRSEAEERAQKVWDSHAYQCVRVVKESYDPVEKTFKSVDIFSRGKKRKHSKYDESKRIAPCITPDNLYSPAGRASIWELMNNTLSEWKITPTELLHSWDHYNRLYNKGTLLQNAIQRTAVAFEESPDSIQERMRKLYKVVDTAVAIIKTERAHVPNLEMGRLNPLIKTLEPTSNKSFLLTAAIVNYIAPAVTLDDKFGRLAVFLSDQRPDWVLAIFDQLLSELLMHRSLLKEILSKCESRGAILVSLAYMSCGQLHKAEEMLDLKFSSEVAHVNKFIGLEMLPETSTVLINLLTIELNASDTLVEGGTLLDQFKVLYQLSRALAWLSENAKRFVGMEEVISARQARLLNSQAIATYLCDYGNPFDKSTALMDLAEASVGAGCARSIANYMLPMLSTPENEALMTTGKKNIVTGMRAIAAIQKRVLKCHFNEMHKRKISEKLDDFCKAMMKKSSMLNKLDGIDESLRDKIKRLLGMMIDGTFTDGVAKTSVSQMIKNYMKAEGFKDEYLIDLNETDKIAEWTLLQEKIDAAGIRDLQGLEHLSLKGAEVVHETEIEDEISKSDLYGKKATEDLW